MNLEYALPTKLLIEDVLAIGQVSDDHIFQRLKTFYSDTTLVRLIEDVEAKYPELESVEKNSDQRVWEITKGDSGYHDSYDIYARSRHSMNPLFCLTACWVLVLTSIWVKTIRFTSVSITTISGVLCVLIGSSPIVWCSI